MTMVLWLWLAAFLPSQDQAGSISGRVVDADMGTPVNGVRVGSDATGWAVTTDGEFVLRNVRPGRHQINLEQLYLAASFSLPISVDLQPGEARRGVEFRVRLHGAVSGRVSSDDGQPVTGATVVAVSAEYTRTGQYGDDPELAIGLWYHRESVAVTDDQGRYVLEGVRAGRPYRLLAFRRIVADRAISRAPLDPAARASTLRPTYYPSASNWDAAVPVVVATGQTRGGMDLVMLAAPSFCVEATITADGAPALMTVAVEPEHVARLVAGATTSVRPFAASSRSMPDGRVRYCGLAPGTWRLSAGESLGPMADEYQGATTFDIEDRDVTGLEMAVHAPATLRGTLSFDGARPDEPVRVSPQPQVGPARTAEASATGEFAVRLGTNWSYSLRLFRLPAGTYVRDVRLDDRSIMLEPLTPPANGAEGTLRIVVGDDAGRAAVTVMDEPGRPAAGAVVILQPAAADTDLALAAGLRSASTDDTGRAVFEGLPPGDYIALATRRPPLMVVQLPSDNVRIARSPETMALLRRTRALGERVTVSPGAEATVTLSLVALR